MLVNEAKALTEDPGVQLRNWKSGRFRRGKNRSLPSSACLWSPNLTGTALTQRGTQRRHPLLEEKQSTHWHTQVMTPTWQAQLGPPLSLLAWPKWLDFPGLSFCIRETRGLNQLMVKGSSSSKTRFFQQRVRWTVTVWIVFQYGYNSTSHPFVPMPFLTLKVRLSFPIP